MGLRKSLLPLAIGQVDSIRMVFWLTSKSEESCEHVRRSHDSDVEDFASNWSVGPGGDRSWHRTGQPVSRT